MHLALQEGKEKRAARFQEVNKELHGIDDDMKVLDLMMRDHQSPNPIRVDEAQRAKYYSQKQH